MTTPRAHRPDSLLRRIEAFFRANPDEWLTYPDMAVKFECTAKQAAQAVHELKRLGAPLESAVVVMGSGR